MRFINAPASLLLIFFLFLFNEAQAIRLGNGMMNNPVGLLEKALEEEIPLVEEGFRKITLCQNGHRNSGNNRKLLTATSPSSPSPSPTRNDEGNKKGNPMSKKEEVSVKEKNHLDNNNSEAVSENLDAGLEHYPNLIDIAEMDYSPAKRKPPIHN